MILQLTGNECVFLKRILKRKTSCNFGSAFDGIIEGIDDWLKRPYDYNLFQIPLTEELHWQLKSRLSMTRTVRHWREYCSINEKIKGLEVKDDNKKWAR